MKKRVFNIVVLIVGVAILAHFYGGAPFNLKAPTAFAVGDLTVDWGIGVGDVGPIFSIPNMAPGQSETKTVYISNGATTNRPVGIRVVLTADPGGLASVMDVVINDGSSDIYGGTAGTKTLANFFSDSSGPSGINLFTLSPGANKNITFTVTFQNSAGNPYQGQNTVFDIKIGIAFDLPAACEGITFSGNPIFGTEKADNITGTPGNDLIVAMEGDDKIEGNSGDDCILGGPGNDRINGNNGKDVIFGESGDDKLEGNNDNDYLDGGPGNDSADGSNGQDTCLAETKKNCEL